MSRTVAAKSERTRRRILRAASAAFREHGIDRVGVREIMKRAGLTRGGFYFHFADKDALLNEAVGDAALASAAEYVSRAESAPEGRKLKALIDGYLSLEHRDHPDVGCVVSALASEAGRGNAKQRTAFTGAIAAILGRVSAYLPGETPEQRFLRAGLLMSSMAGVLMVSRVLADQTRSEALLTAARKFYAESFGER
jgi:TetR/AcrR family transcriptional repressor of nem operon